MGGGLVDVRVNIEFTGVLSDGATADICPSCRYNILHRLDARYSLSCRDHTVAVVSACSEALDYAVNNLNPDRGDIDDALRDINKARNKALTLLKRLQPPK